MRDDETHRSTSGDPRGCVVVFTKPGRPGRVKTRLVAAPDDRGGGLSAEQAAELHLAFLGDLVERLAAADLELALAWALDDGEPIPSPLPPATGASPRALRQRGGDLGERLWNALAETARRRPLVAIVGSDHPTLAVSAIERAFERLRAGAPLVFGPATDGGYYLVAARRESLGDRRLRRVFEDVPWSTGEVLATTLERCRELAIEPALLAPGHDVDTPDDLARLARRLAAGRPPDCPRTRRLLGAWGRLAPAFEEATRR